MPVVINLKDESIQVAPRDGGVVVAERADGVRILQPGPSGSTGPMGPPGGSTISGWWAYSNLETEPPGEGEVRTSLVSGSQYLIHIHETDDDGLSWDFAPGTLTSIGDTIILRSASGEMWSTTITGRTNYTDYVTYEVTLDSGTVQPPRKNERVQVSVVAQSSGGTSENLIVVSDLADIPPGTPAKTVVVLSPGAAEPPTVVSTSSVFEGTSFQVVLPAPATVADGDLLLAVMANQTTVTVNPAGDMTVLPPGFTRVAWPTYPADAGRRWLAVYAKVASGESGDYTFEWATMYGRALGAMLVVRGANSVLGYAGPTSEADNIPALPQVAVAASGTLAVGITHTVHTSGNDGRATFGGWANQVQVIGDDWQTASSNSLTLVTREYASGQTAGGEVGTLNQGSVAADASATLILGTT